MKKSKIYIAIVLIVIVLFSVNVLAHTVELDPDNLISIPFMIINGRAKITIWSEDEDYQLYFQWVPLLDDDYNEILEMKSDYDDFISENESILDAQRDYYRQLGDDWEAERDLDPDSEETAIAWAAYQAAVQEYNDMVNGYNTTVAGMAAEIRLLVPMYIEENWEESEENEVYYDLSQFVGNKAFILWLKLVDSTGTHYDEGIYTMSGTATPTVSVGGITLNKSTLSLKVGESETLIATITPSNATNKAITWTSSNLAVATVENGVVTAKAIGTATITATTVDGEFLASSTITVTAASVEDDTTVPLNKLPDARTKINYTFYNDSIFSSINYIIQKI